MSKQALYFGCLKHAGHFLWMPNGRTLSPKMDVPGIPWDIALMDSGLLKNGKHRDRPDGKVYWTCGGEDALWHAFFWWDRSIDSRPGSNSGFYVRGFALEEKKAAFEYACEKWPEVVKRQKHPLVLTKPEGAEV